MSVDPNAAKAIFMTALDKSDPAERAAYLALACGGDEMLRQRVEVLLKAHSDPGSFLKSPAAGPAPTIDEPITERPGTVIGPYKLLEQIGEGGFGVVFMAEQTQPVRRKVALKILKPGMDTRQVIARFEAERQALAIMDHPNIAKVFDGGATPSGRPYFVMELVKGVPITQFCDQNHLTPRQRLELFGHVCQAVQHAHQKGIIHRDLKPSNVLVTLQDGQPSVKVIDFGVAKALGQELTDKTLFTGFAQLIGTPLYMSPEQAGLSVDIDTRSDIYSLGVLLYELLTGTTPFDRNRFKKAAYDEIRRIIREEEPPKPSTRLSELSRPHAPREETVTRSVTSTMSLASISAQRQMEPAKLTKLVRGELDWIVMKALEKDRNRRYETANGLAMDVQRYLADEPVLAGPPSVRYLRKFVRRNKPVVALLATGCVAALTMIGLILVLWYNRHLREARGETLVALQREQTSLYYHRIGLAEREFSFNNVGRVDQLLDECPAALRGWEWHYLKRLCHTDLITFRGHDRAVDDVAFSPNGRYLASGSGRTVKVWNGATGQEVLRLAVLTDDGRPDRVTSLAFSPDGARLASASGDVDSADKAGEVIIWELTTGRELVRLKDHAGPVQSVAFSPDGRLIASGSGAYNQPGEVKLWDAETAQALRTFRGHRREVISVAFRPDGKWLASASGSMVMMLTGMPRQPGEIKIWDLTTNRELHEFREHYRDITSVAFSPNGSRLASASWDRTVKVRDPATGPVLLTLAGHSSGVTGVRFSPDGSRLASASEDRTVKLWDAQTGGELRTLRGHTQWVNRVSFSRDGNRLASASDDGTVKVWDVTPRQEFLTLRPPPEPADPIMCVAFSPNGRYLAAGGGIFSKPGEIKVWDTATNQEVFSLKGHAQPVTSLGFSPDGRHLASGSSALPPVIEGAGEVRLWDILTGQEIRTLRAPTQGVLGVAYSPDGKRLAWADADGTLKLWDVATGAQERTLRGHTHYVAGVAFSPDGQYLASASHDGTVRLWNATTGQVERTLEHNASVLSLAFSPDSERLASTGEDGTVKVWEVATWQVLFTLKGHTSKAWCAAFRSDGRRLATAGSDRTVKLWDVTSGQEVLTLRGHDDRVGGVAFSPDGQRLVSGSDDGTVRLWDATPLEERRGFKGLAQVK